MNAILSKTKQRSFLLVALLLMGCLQLLAQTRTIKGEVTDAQNGDAHHRRPQHNDLEVRIE